MKGCERIAAALRAHGVPCIFAPPGDEIASIRDAARARGIRVIDTRHESTAVFAADAFGRLSGTPGVALIPAGPALSNVVTALKTAQLAESPLVLIAGATPLLLHGHGAAREIDQAALLAPHVKLARQVEQMRDLVPAIEEAMAVAASDVPGPVCVECPTDLLADEAQARQWYQDAPGEAESAFVRALSVDRRLARMFAGAEHMSAPRVRSIDLARAPQGEVRDAADAIAEAHRPLLVMGRQALLAPQYVTELADAVVRLGVPVYLAEQACGLLGRAHPLSLRDGRRAALREADCVILAGLRCDFRLDFGVDIDEAATLIALNRSEEDALLNRVPTVGLIGDVALSLIEIGRLVSGPVQCADWIAHLRARDDEADRAPAALGAAEAGVDPVALLRIIDQSLDDNAIVIADGGDFVARAARVLRPRKPFSWLDCGPFGTVGLGAGFALAARQADPGAAIWLISDDGAFSHGLAEFEALVHHGVPVIAVVGHAAAASSRSHEIVQGFGAVGIALTRDDEATSVVRLAREVAATGRPVLIDVLLSAT
jgi:thiamine pyrophosphate-dependent acetolactate synthase large subunit-like protein